MTTPRISVACLGGMLALITLCYGVLYGSVDAWRLLLAIVPTLVVFIWWMVDRGALERRIKRLEARSEIALERRLTAQTELTEVEHKLHEIEGRVLDVENFSSSNDGPLEKMESRKTGNGTEPTRLGYANQTVVARLPVN